MEKLYHTDLGKAKVPETLWAVYRKQISEFDGFKERSRILA